MITSTYLCGKRRQRIAAIAPAYAIDLCRGLFLVALCRYILSYFYCNECHECCVDHCDENIHFVPPFYDDYLHDLSGLSF